MTRVAVYLLAFILLLLTLIIYTPAAGGENFGICVSSPDLWHLPKFLGWLINAALIYLSVAIASSANKRFNFIPEAEPVMSMALAIILACNCLTTGTLTSSTILLFFNLLSLYIIISTYEEMNAAKEFFIVGTLPAIGSMFQCAFPVMIPVAIGGGLLMKSFRIRECIAFIFGLAAPYWIAVGLGWVAPEAFRMPEMITVFGDATVGRGLLPTLIAACIMGGAGLILALYNGVRLFNRNSRLRCMHGTFNLMGFMAVAGIIFNFNNLPAYFGMLALWFAIQTATLLYLYNIRRIEVTLAILLAIFLPLYILQL